MSSVCYLMSGAAHLPYLATSLYTLRQHWQGEVRVFAWPESFGIARLLCRDRGIRAGCTMVDPDYRGKNAQFLNKIQVMQSQPYGPNIYLDADTLVNGKLDELAWAGNEYGMACTQFGSWTTKGGVIRGRIVRLREFPEIQQHLIEEVTTKIYPSVNGGVFACTPDSPVLPLWYSWSWAARSIFICDECVLHLMVPMFRAANQLVVLPGNFNSSPKYARESDDIRVWHGHGDCFVRPNKSRRGTLLWLGVLKECLQKNVGSICEWLPSIRHKHFNRLLQEKSDTLEGIPELQALCAGPEKD